MATHSSIFAGKNPTDRGARWATVHGVAKSRAQLKRLSMHAPTGDSESQGHLDSRIGGTSLLVWWLRLHTSTGGGTGSVPDWGTKIPTSHMANIFKLDSRVENYPRACTSASVLYWRQCVLAAQKLRPRL